MKFILIFAAITFISWRVASWFTMRRHVKMVKAVFADELRRKAFWN